MHCVVLATTLASILGQSTLSGCDDDCSECCPCDGSPCGPQCRDRDMCPGGYSGASTMSQPETLAGCDDDCSECCPCDGSPCGP
jgi:hypothetical protein